MAGPYTPNPLDPSMPSDADWAKMGAAELRALKNFVKGRWVPKQVTATEFTVTDDEVGQLIRMVNGGIITVPAGLSPGLLGMTGLQATSLVGATGVTILVPPSLRATLFEDNAFAVAMQVATNIWLISGNLMFR